jgi:hypothetical protein
MRIIIASGPVMTPEQSPVAQALSFEFVADISYNPRTNQYRIDLVEPYRSDLPHEQNFLLLDVSSFTIDNLLDAFENTVIAVYQRKCDEAWERLGRVKRDLEVTDTR